MNFEQLGIQKEIVQALQYDGISEATQIQEKAIPIILSGKDLIGRSKTGSGKTAAFGVPSLQQIKPNQGIQLLVIAPIRELVVQIAQELQKWSKNLNLHITSVYGGVSLQPQIEQMARAEVVVGTPGRLLDHLEHNTADFSKLKCVVLDEADKMVEMGFIEDIDYIMSALPEHRQILLFGATISTEINRLKQKYMHDAVDVEAETHVQEDFLQQFYYTVPMHQKFSLLVHLLKKENAEQAIIFCSARSTVELLTRNLRLQGIKAEMIHGKLSQNRRLQVIENFHKAGQGILVASAVAARGIHIDGLSHVFNYDLSQDPQEYVHRVGRTARAGEKGKAITLLSEKDYEVFREILSRYQVPAQELPLESFPKLPFDARREDSFRRPRFGGDRGFSGNRNAFASRGGSGSGYSGGRNSSFSERRGDGSYGINSNQGRGGRTLPSAPGWRK